MDSGRSCPARSPPRTNWRGCIQTCWPRRATWNKITRSCCFLFLLENYVNQELTWCFGWSLRKHLLNRHRCDREDSCLHLLWFWGVQMTVGKDFSLHFWILVEQWKFNQLFLNLFSFLTVIVNANYPFLQVFFTLFSTLQFTWLTCFDILFFYANIFLLLSFALPPTNHKSLFSSCFWLTHSDCDRNELLLEKIEENVWYLLWKSS